MKGNINNLFVVRLRPLNVNRINDSCIQFRILNSAFNKQTNNNNGRQSLTTAGFFQQICLKIAPICKKWYQLNIAVSIAKNTKSGDAEDNNKNKKNNSPNCQNY